jgi:hypothetical protein
MNALLLRGRMQNGGGRLSCRDSVRISGRNPDTQFHLRRCGMRPTGANLRRFSEQSLSDRAIL